MSLCTFFKDNFIDNSLGLESQLLPKITVLILSRTIHSGDAVILGGPVGYRKRIVKKGGQVVFIRLFKSSLKRQRIAVCNKFQDA